MHNTIAYFDLLSEYLIANRIVRRYIYETDDNSEVAVCSKIDTNGALLGSMKVLLLENGCFIVIGKTGTGTSPLVRSAILAGDIDTYPEYAGNEYYCFPDKTDSELWKDLQKGARR